MDKSNPTLSRASGSSTAELQFLRGSGELTRLIRLFDWSATALGPIDSWPAILKSTTSLILASPVAIVTLWGVDGYMIYNDAYAVFAGGRHPSLLGSKVREGWPEVAAFNDHVMKVVLAGGTLSYRDQPLTLYRAGVAENIWLDLDYSAILDEAGKPAGVIAIVAETTERVLAEELAKSEKRQLQVLLQQMPGFVATLRGERHIYEYVNDAYRALSGSREFIGRSVHDVFPELDAQGYFERMDRVYATAKIASSTCCTNPFATKMDVSRASSWAATTRPRLTARRPRSNSAKNTCVL